MFAQEKAQAEIDKRNAGQAKDEDPNQGVMFANEPTVDYTGRYESDLFGNPLPAAAGKNRPARPIAVGTRGNVQPKPAVRGDTQVPEGEYFVNTHVVTETTRQIGTGVVNTPEQAAQATAYLYKSAVERVDGIVTDKDGNVLAVDGGFKGAISQAAVYPATLMSEAIRVPGAARIWISHNHPSGNSALSAADEALNNTLGDIFRGSGIEPMGILAVGNGRYTHAGVTPYGSGTHTTGAVIAASKPKSVPVYERELSKSDENRPTIHGPDSAKSIAKVYYAKANAPGILMLDTQHGVVGWMPITADMMKPLRDGALNQIYRSISQSNASAAIIVHGGELDALGNLPANVSPSENIAAALGKVDVKALDSINAKTGRSAAEQGKAIAKGPMFSRSPMKSVDANIRRGLDSLAKALDEKTTVHRAMFRNGLGWVDFVWGAEGVVKPSGKTKGAMGLSHIIEARQRKDGMSDAQVVDLLEGIVSTIASGQEVRRDEVSGSITVVVQKNGVEAILTRKSGSNTWLVSGWTQKNPVDSSAGSVASTATLSTPTTAQRGKGAGFGEIVRADGLVVNPDPGMSRSGTTPDVSDPRTGISTALLELGKDDSLYQYPRSDARELKDIAVDKSAHSSGKEAAPVKVMDVDKNTSDTDLWMLANTAPDDNPAENTKSWIVETSSGKYAAITRKGKEVYINVASVGEGNRGSQVYDLAANYALNNGLTFIGDPMGVSKSALRRRLENMLSSAIKYGTTDHLQPHEDQVAGAPDIGVPPLRSIFQFRCEPEAGLSQHPLLLDLTGLKLGV